MRLPAGSNLRVGGRSAQGMESRWQPKTGRLALQAAARPRGQETHVSRPPAYYSSVTPSANRRETVEALHWDQEPPRSQAAKRATHSRARSEVQKAADGPKGNQPGACGPPASVGCCPQAAAGEHHPTGTKLEGTVQHNSRAPMALTGPCSGGRRGLDRAGHPHLPAGASSQGSSPATPLLLMAAAHGHGNETGATWPEGLTLSAAGRSFR